MLELTSGQEMQIKVALSITMSVKKRFTIAIVPGSLSAMEYVN